MNLMGFDIGFSKTNDSTGIACLDSAGRLYLSRAFTNWESRQAALPENFHPSVIAVDGPIVPSLDVRRSCEEIMSRGTFRNRCKPGLSDFGTGLELRKATAATIPDLKTLEPGKIIEAFPNAFLGVLIENETYLNMPDLARGKRFDWLYDCVVDDAHLICRMADTVRLPLHVWEAFRCEKDHELRAAIVCLILAAFEENGICEKVGDEAGGYFWMPPFKLWQNWARQALDSNLNSDQLCCW